MTTGLRNTLFLVLLLLAGTPLLAEEYQGAAAALKQLDRQAVKDGDAEPVSAEEVLRRDLRAFSKEAGSLAPEEAARRWLGLTERYVAMSNNEVVEEPPGSEPLQASTFLAALPPPAAWDALSTAI